MLDVERIDKDFLVANDMSRTGSLYEADPPFVLSTPGGNLTPLPDDKTYRSVYQHHAGKIDYSDLVSLIATALEWPDDKLAQLGDEVLRIDETLRYLAIMAVIQNQDHIKKNYYLYRDPKAADCRWRHIPWDLDISFGRLWTPENDILDDQLFVDGDPFAGVYKGHSFYNGLVERLLTMPQWRARFVTMADRVAQEVMTPAFIKQQVDVAVCRMQPDLLADDHKRSDNDDYIKRVEQLHSFAVGRRKALQSLLKVP